MKAILNLGKHRYLRTVGVFLILIALVAGIASCDGAGDTYELTMAANPVGGGTATDETGGSPYAEGTVVNITAAAADCYRFVDWTAPAGTFADATAAETTFTMPARDVTVTANFEAITLGHFKFYDVSDSAAPPPIEKEVQLEDQFGVIDATVLEAIVFGNPADKVHGDVVTPMSDPDHHLTLYRLEYEQQPQLWRVQVKNQFGDNQQLTVVGPRWLAVPTQKEDHEAPACLDHFLVYEVVSEPVEPVQVELMDEFTDETVEVYEPVMFANPVKKTLGSEVVDIQKPDDHLVFYKIAGEPFEKTIKIDNQFGSQSLALTDPALLGVPSEKISWGQPLDHFKCYDAGWIGEPPTTFPVEVRLEDQFLAELGAINATVGEPVLFGNPAQKWHGDAWTPIANGNNHLTFYTLIYEATIPELQLWVNNQFGMEQVLYVQGPVFLAVPTQKGDQDPPAGLDHFLVYKVMDAGYYPTEVRLKDQFTDEWAGVGYAQFFANPVQKTLEGGEVTEIQHPDRHLVFYAISGEPFSLPELPVANQFGPQWLNVGNPVLVGVPSAKIEWNVITPP